MIREIIQMIADYASSMTNISVADSKNKIRLRPKPNTSIIVVDNVACTQMPIKLWVLFHLNRASPTKCCLLVVFTNVLGKWTWCCYFGFRWCNSTQCPVPTTTERIDRFSLGFRHRLRHNRCMHVAQSKRNAAHPPHNMPPTIAANSDQAAILNVAIRESWIDRQHNTAQIFRIFSSFLRSWSEDAHACAPAVSVRSVLVGSMWLFIFFVVVVSQQT